MPKPSLDGSQPDSNNNTGNENSRRLTQDLNNLQHEIRMDFDQRISDLSNLMSKFRSLMVCDIRLLNAANDSKAKAAEDNIPLLTKKIDDSTLAKSKVINSAERFTAKDKPAIPEQSQSQPTESPARQAAAARAPKTANPYAARETARFEAGLYQLNCQLYRFRLELDQELEYRDEPLHVHFSDPSELASVLQQITQKKHQEKHTDR